MTTMRTQSDALVISKSKFLWGMQCRKLLWNAYNAEPLFPEPDAQAQAIFDQGREIGNLAKTLFLAGIEVDQGVADLDQALGLTQQALKLRLPLFEAAFSHQGGFAKSDILVPADDDTWDIVEVKSSTSVKKVNILDLAFQSFVIAGAGLKIRRCFLLLINPDYVRCGEVDPAKFFVRHDVTAQVMAASGQIESRLEEMFSVVRLKGQPEVRIGPHCDAPYACPLHDQCWSFLPPDNVTTLYRGAKKGFQLLAGGVNQIKDIPQSYRLTENQKIQRQVAVTGQPYFNKPAIREFLRQIEYPISYLDFETFAPAIPLLDNASPFEQVPFQFSLHTVQSPGGQPDHRMFLAEGRTDPRREFLQKLQEWLPENGSIVVYNQQFEQSRLRECCQLHPQFQPWFNNLESRFLDLLVPFRAFYYYGPGQGGSASIKNVLPVLVGRSYESLTIRDGAMASQEFLRVHFTKVSEDERQRVRQALEEYCREDTAAMIWILEGLRKLVSR